MADGRSRDEWTRTSAQMALLANCHRDPKKGRARKPADFDPYSRRRRKRQPRVEVGIGVLRDVFVPREQ